MSYLRRPYSYSNIEDEDPEERLHRRAQFLIARVLEQADSRRRQPSIRVRIFRLTVKIGRRLRRLRKSIKFTVSVAKVGVWRPVMGQMKLWKWALRGREAMVSLPPLFC
ncbi:uncharacterized protein LOC143882610 [Tasmannia lanceolata]|uniref:uncharacterized protein LOC143882610 n=1 Tax=Tasmannia lanceolata TaxID=3420 RepID=UPI004063B93D